MFEFIKVKFFKTKTEGEISSLGHDNSCRSMHGWIGGRVHLFSPFKVGTTEKLRSRRPRFPVLF